MNILLVTMSMQIGGAETHVLELAKGLKRHGYNVYVMSNGGDYVKELEEYKIEHIQAPIHNRNFSNMIKSYQKLKKTIQEKKIDIVHAHARIPAMIAYYACKAVNVPMVTTAHGVYKVNAVLKMMTKWGEKSIAVSDDVKEYLMKEYEVPAEDITITVNGIDMQKFSHNIDYSSLTKELNVDMNKKHIVHVSRLDDETSLVANLLIDLAEKFEEAQFIIVGSGTKFEELKKKADMINEKLGISKIVMPGGRTDINRFDALADIFVGVSRAALEAMSAETPVILAGNQGYLGIFAENNLKKALETNFCCRGLALPTSERIRDDLTKLIDRINGMGKYNREIVEKYYSIEKMVGDAIHMYQSI